VLKGLIKKLTLIIPNLPPTTNASFMFNNVNNTSNFQNIPRHGQLMKTYLLAYFVSISNA
jgi:hypothetical protein